uniref:Uncharacterized protein n=1 Tax=Meloidogyne incognita TaxID=6306 RepID=A0A914M5E5_MELIC
MMRHEQMTLNPKTFSTTATSYRRSLFHIRSYFSFQLVVDRLQMDSVIIGVSATSIANFTYFS